MLFPGITKYKRISFSLFQMAAPDIPTGKNITRDHGYFWGFNWAIMSKYGIEHSKCTHILSKSLVPLTNTKSVCLLVVLMA